jgi:hypothetical protein
MRKQTDHQRIAELERELLGEEHVFDCPLDREPDSKLPGKERLGAFCGLLWIVGVIGVIVSRGPEGEGLWAWVSTIILLAPALVIGIVMPGLFLYALVATALGRDLNW